MYVWNTAYMLWCNTLHPTTEIILRRFGVKFKTFCGKKTRPSSVHLPSSYIQSPIKCKLIQQIVYDGIQLDRISINRHPGNELRRAFSSNLNNLLLKVLQIFSSFKQYLSFKFYVDTWKKLVGKEKYPGIYVCVLMYLCMIKIIVNTLNLRMKFLFLDLCGNYVATIYM